MTMPSERTRALRWAEEFLREVRTRSDVPEDLKHQALVILRHYPESHDIKRVAEHGLVALHANSKPAYTWLAPEDGP